MSLAKPQRALRASKWASAPKWKLLQMSEKDISTGTSGRFRTETSPFNPENQKYGATMKCHWPSMSTFGLSCAEAVAGNAATTASAVSAARLMRAEMNGIFIPSLAVCVVPPCRAPYGRPNA